MQPIFNICGEIYGCFKGKLNMAPNVLADILDGTITKWNDPKITAYNEDGTPFTFPCHPFHFVSQFLST